MTPGVNTDAMPAVICSQHSAASNWRTGLSCVILHMQFADTTVHADDMPEPPLPGVAGGRLQRGNMQQHARGLAGAPENDIPTASYCRQNPQYCNGEPSTVLQVHCCLPLVAACRWAEVCIISGWAEQYNSCAALMLSAVTPLCRDDDAAAVQ